MNLTEQEDASYMRGLTHWLTCRECIGPSFSTALDLHLCRVGKHFRKEWRAIIEKRGHAEYVEHQPKGKGGPS